MLEERNALFHVVCRDCDLESLEDARELAERVAEDHQTHEDHRISFARIA